MPQASTAKMLDATSQDSDDDNNTAYMATVMQQVHTTWEKKRKDQETRFLQYAAAELEGCSAEKVEQFAEVIDEMQAIYDHFVMEYAAAEDAIRAKWVQLLTAQESCQEFGKSRLSISADADRARRKGHIRGLAITKKALEDGQALIRSLNSETKESMKHSLKID